MTRGNAPLVDRPSNPAKPCLGEPWYNSGGPYERLKVHIKKNTYGWIAPYVKGVPEKWPVNCGYMQAYETVAEEGDEAPAEGTGFVVVVTEIAGHIKEAEYDLKMSYSLVLLMGYPPWTDGIVRLLAGAKYPFLVAAGPMADAANCTGGILCDSRQAVEDFAEHCRQAHIRRVTVVRKWRSNGGNVAAALRAVGAKVDFLTVPQRKGRGRPEELWQASFAAFERRFARNGTKWLPDLLFFTDDHCFQGAAMSLMSRRVRVPLDVRIVTVANSGMRPPFSCSVACLENDLDAQAEVISGAMLDFLDRGRPVATGLSLGCSYIHGETFPGV